MLRDEWCSALPALNDVKLSLSMLDSFLNFANERCIDQFCYRPHMVRNAKLHRRRDAQGFVNAAHIVVRNVQGDGSTVVQVGLAEAVRKPREPALRHAQREVLALNVGRADMCRRAAYYVLRYLYYLARRIAACGFRRLVYRVVLFRQRHVRRSRQTHEQCTTGKR